MDDIERSRIEQGDAAKRKSLPVSPWSSVTLDSATQHGIRSTKHLTILIVDKVARIR